MHADQHEFPGYAAPWSPTWATANAWFMTDTRGRRVLDLAQCFGARIHGHIDIPQLLRNGLDQLGNAPGLGDLATTGARSSVNAALTTRAHEQGWTRELRSLVFHTGSEAVDMAIRTAIMATGRSRIASFEGAYHGTSGCALAATWSDHFRAPLAALLPPETQIERYPWGIVPEVADDVACVIVEPIQGRAGVRIPPDGFLTGLRRECTRAGALLIVDSVMTGGGRTGDPLVDAGLNPDLLCLGKAIGSGFPVSAVIAAADVAEAAWGDDARAGREPAHTSTHVGDVLGCAAISQSLALYDELDPADRTRDLAAALVPIADRLAGVSKGTELRCRGALAAIDTGVPGGGVDLARRLLEAGVIVVPSGSDGSSITLFPPLGLPAALMEQAVETIAAAIAQPGR